MPEEHLKKVVVEEPTYHNVQHVAYYILGALEILLAFRFVLKLTGANPGSGFVAFIYGLSQIFVAPFVAIFGVVTAPGAETTAVFEPSTLVGMAVYAVIGWGIVKLIGIMAKRPHDME